MSLNIDKSRSFEGGMYMCRCHRCEHNFIGHKLQVTCKLCEESPEYKEEMHRLRITHATEHRDSLRARLREAEARLAKLKNP